MPKFDTQLTQPEAFNEKSLIFDPIQKKKTPDNVDYHQASIRMKYPDGCEGPLILQLPRSPSYGISNKYGDTADKLSLSIILGERDTIDDEHKLATDVINKILKAAKNFILTEENKTKLMKDELEERDLKNMSPLKLQRDRETKKLLASKPQILNVKMRTRNDKETKSKQITSVFYVEGEFDGKGNPLVTSPYDLIGKSGYCTACIIFESIYIGKDFKLQAKVYECDYKANESGFKSLLRKPGAPSSTSSLLKAVNMDYDDEDEEPISKDELAADAEEEPEEIISKEDEVEEEPEEEEERPPTPPPEPKKKPSKRNK
jgi:hypothetical protein